MEANKLDTSNSRHVWKSFVFVVKFVKSLSKDHHINHLIIQN